MARRKTLASVKISIKGGLSLKKVRRPDGRPAALPAARAAEQLVCTSLGITKDGEAVTSATLDAFAEKFKDELSPEIIVAMRDFFKLDDTAIREVEEALLTHGGEGAIDLAAARSGEGEQLAVA